MSESADLIARWDRHFEKLSPQCRLLARIILAYAMLLAQGNTPYVSRKELVVAGLCGILPQTRKNQLRLKCRGFTTEFRAAGLDLEYHNGSYCRWVVKSLSDVRTALVALDTAAKNRNLGRAGSY